MAHFSRILFPTDFSAESSSALRHGLRLLDVETAEVIVLHVVGTYFEKHSHWTTLFDIHEQQKFMDMYVETELSKSTADGNGLSFRCVLSEGRPAERIPVVASEEEAELVVMGPTAGVVTGSVIRQIDCPLLAIPARTDPDTTSRVSRIVVTTDLSPESKTLVRLGMELKQQFDCEVYLLHVIELSGAIRFGIRQGHFRDAVTKMKTWAEDQLENLTPHEFVNDPKVHRVVEEGHAAEVITRIANSKDAGLVLMGAHDHGAVERFFAGSTTDRILSDGRQPILTLHL